MVLPNGAVVPPKTISIVWKGEDEAPSPDMPHLLSKSNAACKGVEENHNSCVTVTQSMWWGTPDPTCVLHNMQIGPIGRHFE